MTRRLQHPLIALATAAGQLVAHVALAAPKPVAVYRAYDGAALAPEKVSRLYAPNDTRIWAFDGRSPADVPLGVYFELPAGTHTVRLRYEAPPGSAGFVKFDPLTFEFEPGRVYRVRWEDRKAVMSPSIEPYAKPLPAAAGSSELCWFEVLHGQVDSFVWGKTFRERLKQTPRLTLRLDGVAEPRTWLFPSRELFVRPEGTVQGLGSRWNADGVLFGYHPGIDPLVPGRRVRALVSICRPDEIREVILE